MPASLTICAQSSLDRNVMSGLESVAPIQFENRHGTSLVSQRRMSADAAKDPFSPIACARKRLRPTSDIGVRPDIAWTADN